MSGLAARWNERLLAGGPPRAMPAQDVNDSLVLAMMDRIGVSLAPEIFQFEVARAYEAIQTGTTPAGEIEPQLRACHSYPKFQAALHRAGPARDALILGCGEGLPGLDGDYAIQEFREIRTETPNVGRLAVSLPALLDDAAWEPEAYDVVVTHSMNHFVYRLDLLFDRIRQVLRPGGIYVMGKEVNARFFQRPELVSLALEMNKELAGMRRRRAWSEPRGYYLRLGRWLGVDDSISKAQGVNLLLRRRLEASGDLSAAEQSRLIEIHRPLLPLSDSQIGMQGFDAASLADSYLADFDLEWIDSSGYLGYRPYHEWPQEWRRRNDRLQAANSGDGVFFSACWRRTR